MPDEEVMSRCECVQVCECASVFVCGAAAKHATTFGHVAAQVLSLKLQLCRGHLLHVAGQRKRERAREGEGERELLLLLLNMHWRKTNKTSLSVIFSNISFPFSFIFFPLPFFWPHSS